MKLQIRTTFDFKKMFSKSKPLVADFLEGSINLEVKKMKSRIKKGQQIRGAMKKIRPVTKITRILRGQNPSAPPLNGSGRLLNSIKGRKQGISAKEYGYYHNYGFTTKNNPIIPKKGRGKGKLKRRQFFFGKSKKGGNRIPARRWFHDNNTYKYDKYLVRSFLRQLTRGIRK